LQELFPTEERERSILRNLLIHNAI